MAATAGAFPRPAQRSGAVRVAGPPEVPEGLVVVAGLLLGSGLGGGHSVACALRDHLPLMLSDRSHDGDRKAIGLGHVACNELNAGLVKPEEKMSIAREAVKLGDDE
jgi:hypothetical protein